MHLLGKTGLPGAVAATAVLIAAAVFLPVPAESADPTDAERAAAARTLIVDFAGGLRGELQTAMQAGGPEAAISVCNAAAPRIAEEKAAETGWSVARTALRLRNPANAPDAWERTVLDMFLAKATQGADLATLEHYETTVKGGKRVFRYMRAIPTQKPCLACHGTLVSETLRSRINEFYPDDQAVGFSLGELRGAFTIIQPIE